jgi:uncharacterized protein YcnI
MNKLIGCPAGLLLVVLSTAASAHVTVWPEESAAAEHEKYEVPVPNEKQVDTVAI